MGLGLLVRIVSKLVLMALAYMMRWIILLQSISMKVQCGGGNLQTGCTETESECRTRLTTGPCWGWLLGPDVGP